MLVCTHGSLLRNSYIQAVGAALLYTQNVYSLYIEVDFMTNLSKVKTSVIRTFVVEPKCPDYGGSIYCNPFW